jgi:pilus assembly protein FimV
LAEELYAALEGKGGKVWEKAEEMGQKLSPTNPMFRGGKPAAHNATRPTTMMVDETSADAAIDTSLESMLSTQGLEPAAAATSSGLDFNMDFDAQQSPTSEPSSKEQSFDMSFDMNADTAASAASNDSNTSSFDMDFNIGAPESNERASNSNMVDFNTSGTQEFTNELDFSTSGDSPTSAGEVEEFSLGESGDSEVGMGGTQSLDAAGEDSVPGWDETATKLDLAKAYIDMGDSEGARSILEEVIAEGNDSQKQQAENLVSQIAA